MLIKSPTKLESWLRQTLHVRPSTGAANPERNDEWYCTYCTRHTNYGYRPAYVEQLVPEVLDGSRLHETGREACA